MAIHDDIDHTGLTGVGVADHGALSGLTDDDHPQYVKDSEFGGKGRILAGTGSGTFDDLPAGTDGHVLTLDSGETMGMKWAAPGGGTTPTLMGCRASRTATQSIPNITETNVEFTATDETDTDSFHDPGSNPDRVTIPTGGDGFYAISAWGAFANNTTGTFRLFRIYVDSTMVAEVQAPFHANVGNSVTPTCHLALTAGQIVRLKVYHDISGGGALNLLFARMSVVRIAA